MGHSCWLLSGTFCDGQVQGSALQKEKGCRRCQVYQQYHRTEGRQGDLICKKFPEEEKKYFEVMMRKRLEEDTVINLRGKSSSQVFIKQKSLEKMPAEIIF
ncbi:MAG: hypothetical protein OEM02_04985 [Desulfobulbaceae bacterium]|nr:hypothetical protein [Desulfobulbaceae bacterium]